MPESRRGTPEDSSAARVVHARAKVSIYRAEAGEIAIAVSGDTMLTRRLDVFDEAPYLALAKILRESDAAFTNLETTVHEHNECTPGYTRGTYMTTEPRLLQDLRWLGINLVSCANNHAFNFGAEGIAATNRYLDGAGIVHAGSGRNLAEARAPAFLDTPNGRVGLVAATSSFLPWEAAGQQRQDVPGRPGVNPLGFDRTHTVDAATFNELKRANEALGFEKENQRSRLHWYSDKDVPPDRGRDMRFLGNRFVEGTGFSISTRANRRDVEGIVKWVREARKQSDYVMVSIHCHEYGGETLLTAGTRVELEEMGEFFSEVAHQCIDNGAHIVAGHGPHFPMGVEIYKGRPIFHSLGTFVMQIETVRYIADDAYEAFDLGWDATPSQWFDARNKNDTRGHPGFAQFWQNFIAVCRFSADKLDRVEIHPIDQGHKRAWAQRGRPVLAGGKVADAIFERVTRISRRYGTSIKVDGGVGVIRP